MKEFLDTISEQLKRIASEGESFVAVDEQTLSILKKMYDNIEKSSVDTFVDNVEAVKFATVVDLQDTNVNNEKKIKIVQTQTDILPIPTPKPFTLPEGDKNTKWEALKNIVLNDKVCNEHIKPTKKIVFGVGNLDAKIFFCGEAPGADEEIQGEPFVGKAGQLLTKIIGAMGLSREEVYIGNIMNWRPEVPKGNRPPTQQEMSYCLPYLKSQIDIVKPDVIVALGMTAVNGLLGYDAKRKMGEIRGKWQHFNGSELMITYHPSFLIQYASAKVKRLVWEDMMEVMKKVHLPISSKQEAYFLPKD